MGNGRARLNYGLSLDHYNSLKAQKGEGTNMSKIEGILTVADLWDKVFERKARGAKKVDPRTQEEIIRDYNITVVSTSRRPFARQV